MSRRDPHERHQDGADRPDYRAGLPDHHDPLAGFGGAPAAQSALTMRLGLASFGLLACGAAGGWLISLDMVGFGIFLLVLGVVALVDIGVIVARKRRGEPG